MFLNPTFFDVPRADDAFSGAAAAISPRRARFSLFPAGESARLPPVSSELPESLAGTLFLVFSEQIVVIIVISCPCAAHIYMQIFIFTHITIY